MKRFLGLLLVLLASSAFAQEPAPKTERGLGYVPLTPERRAHFQKISHAKHGHRLTMMAANQALPAAYDVRTKIPLPVWDQGSCLASGSLVLMANKRLKAIETIEVGEEVITAFGRSQKVLKLHKRKAPSQGLRIIDSRGSQLRGTRAHEVLTRNGWRHIEDINVGDEVKRDNGTSSDWYKVDRSGYIDYVGWVYDVEVDVDHSYVAEGFVVHNCGSCYLVSTVRTATSVLVGLGYGKADNSFMLSAQYGMDSPRNFGGCNGGNGTEVIDWMCKNGWVAETYIDSAGVHNDYPPYEARSRSDRTKLGAKKWMVGADWGFVNANGRPTTEEIKAALYNYGRLNVALDAGGQFSNGTGTITSMGNSIDHEINVVAYDDAKGAFLLENQWSTDWGVDGCRWVTYSAAKNIVDWFYVTAGPLPPPPPDPTPPGPIPPGPIGMSKITFSSPGMPDQVFGVTLPGGAGVNPKMTLEELFKLMQAPKMPPVVEPPVEKSELIELRKNQERMLALMESYSGRLKRLEDTVGTAKASAPKTTTITVKVPAGAVVKFNGRPDARTETVRQFTPTVYASEYPHRFTVQVNGVSRVVSVRTGEHVTEDFRSYPEFVKQEQP